MRTAMVKQALELIEECVEEAQQKRKAKLSGRLMRALAHLAGKEQEEAAWQTAGLLHDLDCFIKTIHVDLPLHGLKTVEILKDREIGNEQVYQAIAAHNPHSGVMAENMMQRAMIVADCAVEAVAEVEKAKKEYTASDIFEQMKKQMTSAQYQSECEAFCTEAALTKDKVFAALAEAAAVKKEDG